MLNCGRGEVKASATRDSSDDAAGDKVRDDTANGVIRDDHVDCVHCEQIDGVVNAAACPGVAFGVLVGGFGTIVYFPGEGKTVFAAELIHLATMSNPYFGGSGFGFGGTGVLGDTTTFRFLPPECWLLVLKPLFIFLGREVVIPSTAFASSPG